MSQALRRLEGRVGLVSFGAPGDWAVGVQLVDEPSAAAVIPALRAWSKEVTAKSGLDLGANTVTDAVPGAPGEVLLSRPAAHMEGLRYTHVGGTLVAVRQRSRLLTLLQHRTLRAQQAAEHPTVGTLLTPMVRQIVDRPGMLLGYMVLGDDGFFFDWAAWAAAAGQQAWHKVSAERPELAFVDKILAVLPPLLVLEGFNWAMTYDIAVAADIDDSVLVVQIAGSEI
jgi:hypothetical protein